jgi:hypothetical protein
MASLIKNTAGQHMKFVLVSATTGAADPTGTGLAGKVTADNGAQATTVGTFTNLGAGQYDYAPTQGETNGTDVGFLFTATGDIPVHFDFHTDTGPLAVDVSGNAAVTSNVKRNTAQTIVFPMTDSTNHGLKPSIVFIAGGSQISKDAGAPVNTANLPFEVGGGLYAVNLQAAETNCSVVGLIFSAAGADPAVLTYPTQP